MRPSNEARFAEAFAERRNETCGCAGCWTAEEPRSPASTAAAPAPRVAMLRATSHSVGVIVAI